MKEKPAVEIAILQDETYPGRPCPPSRVLVSLVDDGKAPNFLEMLPQGSRGMGVCHEASMALLTDLHRAGKSKGWRLVSGYAGREGVAHTWLECDGWAVETAYGFVAISRADRFRELKGGINVVARYSAGQFMAAHREGRFGLAQ